MSHEHKIFLFYFFDKIFWKFYHQIVLRSFCAIGRFSTSNELWRYTRFIGFSAKKPKFEIRTILKNQLKVEKFWNRCPFILNVVRVSLSYQPGLYDLWCGWESNYLKMHQSQFFTKVEKVYESGDYYHSRQSFNYKIITISYH